jgi:cleavage and polyadenylation specificity factor subunit 1
VLHSDSTVIVYDESSDELEPLAMPKDFASTKWLSACVYQPTSTFEGKDENALLFLLSPEGGLRIYDLSDLKEPAYKTEALPYLPSFIADDFVPRRYAARQALTEIMMADIGDGTAKTPHMIVSFDHLSIFC